MNENSKRFDSIEVSIEEIKSAMVAANMFKNVETIENTESKIEVGSQQMAPLVSILSEKIEKMNENLEKCSRVFDMQMNNARSLLSIARNVVAFLTYANGSNSSIKGSCNVDPKQIIADSASVFECVENLNVTQTTHCGSSQDSFASEPSDEIEEITCIPDLVFQNESDVEEDENPISIIDAEMESCAWLIDSSIHETQSNSEEVGINCLIEARVVLRRLSEETILEAISGRKSEVDKESDENLKMYLKFTTKLAGGVYKCQICRKHLKSNLAVVHHMRVVHLHLKPYRCNVCDKRYKQMYFLKQHLQSVHKSNQKQLASSFDCDNCTKSFPSKRSLTQHNSFVHMNKDAIKCNGCGKTLKSKYYLPSHLKGCSTNQANSRRNKDPIKRLSTNENQNSWLLPVMRRDKLISIEF